jgi:hypothetical protein
MFKTFTAVSAIALTCLAASATLAQEAAPATEPAPAAEPAPVASPVPTPAPAPAFVPKNTMITVEVTDLVTTRTAAADDTFNLKLAEPVMLNGAVVIPAGTMGKGVVIDAGKPGIGGKPGKLVVSARYLDLNGRQVPIRALKLELTSQSNTGKAVAVGMAIGMAGLLVAGGHMEIQPGMRGTAKLISDFVPGDAPLAPSEPAAVAQPVAPDTSAPGAAAQTSS